MLCKLHESIPKAIASLHAIEYGYKDVTNYTNDKSTISCLQYINFTLKIFRLHVAKNFSIFLYFVQEM